MAFPLALPMGWVESPPYFTAFTETACDLANSALQVPQSRQHTTVHRLETVSNTPPADAEPTFAPIQPCAPAPTLHQSGRPPVAGVDVYVDDFLLMAQTRAQRTKVLRSTLHAIDAVFRPLDPHNPPLRKEPASVKKLLKADAYWSTTKRTLGWDLDTVESTLRLPPHRIDRLREVLSWLKPPRKRIPTRQWQQILGKLRSMSPALPGTRGLFSALQDALSKGDRARVRLNRHIYVVAADFTALVDAVATRPTRMQELVPPTPSDVGACDACRWGMGGVWFDVLGDVAPILWRQAFPTPISSALVSSDNPRGTISISDLELTGVLAHTDVLAHDRDIAERTFWIASDNRAAIAWANKGSATSAAVRAHLLRYAALHQRRFRYVSRTHYMPGPVNVMADDASRLWHLSDSQLFSHFNTTYPQAVSWQMLRLPSATNASLIGALSRTPLLPCGDLLSKPPTDTRPGLSGRRSVPASASMPPTSPAASTPSLFCNCLPTATGPATLLPVVDLSGLVWWKTPYERWARRMPGWGPQTLV